MTANESDGLEWAVAQRELIRQVNLWIDEAMQRQEVVAWLGTTDESTFMLSWMPHYFLTGRQDLLAFMLRMRDRRQTWAEKNLVHGYYSANAEEHHHTEDYMRFLARLWYLDAFDPRNTAPVLDFAHHLGNWVEGVPPWYDWDRHVFVSRYVGVWCVSDDPEHLHNTPAFFRYCTVLMQAYLMSAETRYLDLVRDYAGHWCDLAEQTGDDEPLPAKIDLDGNVLETEDRPVGWVTGGGLSTLIDLFLLTGQGRYAHVARRVLERFLPPEGPMCGAYGSAEAWAGALRLAAGDRTFDERVVAAAGDPAAAAQTETLSGTGLLPHMTLAWAPDDARAGGGGAPRCGALLALAYQITGDERYAACAMRQAWQRVETARSLGNDGRAHGCASGNANGVVMDQALTTLYPVAMGLVNVRARGTGHHRPLVTYRGGDGSWGLPDGVAARVHLGDAGERPVGAYTVTLANLSEEPRVVRVVGHDAYMKRRIDGLPWVIARQRMVPSRVHRHPWEEVSTVALKLAPGQQRTVTLPEAD